MRYFHQRKFQCAATTSKNEAQVEEAEAMVSSKQLPAIIHWYYVGTILGSVLVRGVFLGYENFSFFIKDPKVSSLP